MISLCAHFHLRWENIHCKEVVFKSSWQFMLNVLFFSYCSFVSFQLGLISVCKRSYLNMRFLLFSLLKLTVMTFPFQAVCQTHVSGTLFFLWIVICFSGCTNHFFCLIKVCLFLILWNEVSGLMKYFVQKYLECKHKLASSSEPVSDIDTFQDRRWGNLIIDGIVFTTSKPNLFSWQAV